jgi:hypothetical protein
MSKTFVNSKLVKSWNGCLIYKIPSQYKVSEMFETIEQLEKELDIADIAVSNSSLEDVFMNVVGKFDIKTLME